jgi:hypothetical protein
LVLTDTVRMTSVQPDGSAVRHALEHASEQAARLVREGAPLDGPVPGLEWTKAQSIGGADRPDLHQLRAPEPHWFGRP